MQNGAVVALVSDAGTPAISDPGYKLVRECINAGIPITGAPGPTSVIAGLVISGLPTDQFFFRGFLPTKKAARRQIIKALRPVPGTLIFMESPRRLAAALNDLSDILGDRSAAVGRELTKLYEEVRRGTITELRDHYGAAPPPKGEVLVMVGPGKSGEMLTLADLEPEIIGRLRSESARDIARDLASESGISRREVYRWVVEIAKHLGQDG
jgi:16S rRNA (cytidine1402-2'-O)-methyltransferase